MAAGGGWVLVHASGPDAAKALAATPHASYLTGDWIAATPTFLYRPYRSKRVGAANTPTWVLSSRPRTAFGGLEGGVAEQEADLFEVAAGFATEFGAGAAQVVGARKPSARARA